MPIIIRDEPIHKGTRDEILDFVYSQINYNPDIGEHFHYLNHEIVKTVDEIAESKHKIGRVFYAKPNLVNIEYSLGLRDETTYTHDELVEILDPSNKWKNLSMEPSMIIEYVTVQIIRYV